MTQKSTQNKSTVSKKKVGTTANTDKGLDATKLAAPDVSLTKTAAATTFEKVTESLGLLRELAHNRDLVLQNFSRYILAASAVPEVQGHIANFLNMCQTVSGSPVFHNTPATWVKEPNAMQLLIDPTQKKLSVRQAIAGLLTLSFFDKFEIYQRLTAVSEGAEKFNFGGKNHVVSLATYNDLFQFVVGQLLDDKKYLESELDMRFPFGARFTAVDSKDIGFISWTDTKIGKFDGRKLDLLGKSNGLQYNVSPGYGTVNNVMQSVTMCFDSVSMGFSHRNAECYAAGVKDDPVMELMNADNIIRLFHGIQIASSEVNVFINPTGTVEDIHAMVYVG